MRIRIHRGTKEIGGTCIEVESKGKRIALDVGLPLDAPDDGHESLLPRAESTRGVRAWLEEHGIPLQIIHTSGHASVADLKRFAAALAPRRLVPIHSFETGRFAEFFDNVTQQDDGVWWEV